MTSFRWRIVCVLFAMPLAATTRADVSLVQLTAANIDEHVTGQARQLVAPGDVILHNEMVQVAVFASGSANRRAGELLALRGASMLSDGALATIDPGPPIAWSRPEAGANADLAVVRFHHADKNWAADLTYRLRSGTGWVEVTTRIVNKSEDEVLEVPVVDSVRPFDGIEIQSTQEGMLQIVDDAKSRAAAYLAIQTRSHSHQTRDAWNLGFVSGDPMPSVMRRVSGRLRSLGRSSATYSPIDVPRDWHRKVRDRETFFRLDPGQQRTMERRLVIGDSLEEVSGLVRLAMDKVGVEPLPESTAPVVENTPTTVSLPKDQPKSAPGTLSVKPSDAGGGKIVGRLRPSKDKDVTPPNPLPKAVLHPPTKPAAAAETAAQVKEAQDGLAPTIDAIEDLPPPIE